MKFTIHTTEELRDLSNKSKLVHELLALSNQFTDDRVLTLARELEKEVAEELKKYEYLIGTEVHMNQYLIEVLLKLVR